MLLHLQVYNYLVRLELTIKQENGGIKVERARVNATYPSNFANHLSTIIFEWRKKILLIFEILTKINRTRSDNIIFLTRDLYKSYKIKDHSIFIRDPNPNLARNLTWGTKWDQAHISTIPYLML